MLNHFFGACVALLFVLQYCAAQEVKPIHTVFVHGLAGFGSKDELGPINYWGIVGENYVESEMLFPPEKFTMHEASVGPVSSNWDRACELYAQIVGGQVDYGEAHSHNVHDRKGKTYAKGFVEDWGPDNPIALVGHSMGGQTIRMLEILLNEGAPAEVTKSGDDVSPLFKGSNKGWIRSITTISTPHDGTTLVSAMGGSLVGLVKNLVGGFAGIAGDSVVDLLYDFDLDHFQLTKGDSESYREYHERVMKSKLWEPGFKDYAGYDLSLEGAEKMNAMGPQAYPETTYFAVITSQTFRGFIPFSKYFFPHITCSVLMAPFAVILGHFGSDFAWRESDGVVPVISQSCPKAGVKSGVTNCLNPIPTSGKPERGKWHQVTVARDHLQVIGLSVIYNNRGIYADIANHILSVGDNGASAQPSMIDPEDLVELNVNFGRSDRAYTIDNNNNDGTSTGGVPPLLMGAAGAVGVGAVAGAAFFVVRKHRNKREMRYQQQYYKNNDSGLRGREQSVVQPAHLVKMSSANPKMQAQV